MEVLKCCREDEVLIKVEATALNRADTIQRKGSYPPPKGASEYPGLECSGTIEAVGSQVSRWKIGDQVCALLSGGGYAEKVVVPAGQVLPIPPGVSLKDAASFPEVACTVWSTIFMMRRLSAGETLLEARKNRQPARTSKQTCASEDFVAQVKKETGGKGANVILDNTGASYLQRNLDSLNIGGRLFIIGFMGGTVTQVNLACLLARRFTVQAAGLQNRSPENKAETVSEVEKNVAR
ncbi:Alcohol dehydrogenase, N-terminal [Dillenia turbinata]|uniref:Alcohol dehydrogenase, N-terminal n=1 Tax=Dillenia turbinata TaxID=194707 RepID=A0AAN8VRD6_9MAGN